VIVFRDVPDDEPSLSLSPLLRAIQMTIAYAVEHDGIPLTPAGAFKRSFVHWAAAAFSWPRYTEADLFLLNKVLNEADFPPLQLVHELLVALKVGRHFKGRFSVNKRAIEMTDRPGRLFGLIVPNFLFGLDHRRHGRFAGAGGFDWEATLNALNLMAEEGFTGREARLSLCGEPEPDLPFDELMMALYTQVLRPLCWAGMLKESRSQADRI
jgi:hypothetical protein